MGRKGLLSLPPEIKLYICRYLNTHDETDKQQRHRYENRVRPSVHCFPPTGPQLMANRSGVAFDTDPSRDLFNLRASCQAFNNIIMPVLFGENAYFLRYHLLSRLSLMNKGKRPASYVKTLTVLTWPVPSLEEIIEQIMKTFPAVQNVRIILDVWGRMVYHPLSDELLESAKVTALQSLVISRCRYFYESDEREQVELVGPLSDCRSLMNIKLEALFR